MTKAQQLRAELSEVAHESFDGAMVVKTLGREAEETARFSAKAHELRDINIRAGRIRAAFDPTLAALPSLGVLVVLVVGVERVLHGATAPGDVVTVAYLLTIVSFPIRSIGWLLGEFPRSVVGFDRVQSVLDATGDMPYGDAVTVREGAGARLEIDRLGYRYDEAQPMLEEVTFTVEPGRTVALVGATASGKSTLTSLLTRLVDPDDGRVLLDGTDLRDLARGELAGTVAVVPQSRVPLRRHRARQRHPRRRRHRRAGVGSAARRPGRRVRRGAARRASTPASASAARPSPAASGSGSHSPARWSAARAC